MQQSTESRPRPTRAGWQLLLQVVVVGAALVYLGTIVSRHWETLRTSHLELSVAPLLLASTLTIATYAFMVWTWTLAMRWWGPTLAFAPAWRIWALSNLSRFIPGYVWQFAGLAGMSARAGVSPVAATGSVLLQQLVSLLSGALVCAALFPAIAGAALPLTYTQAAAVAVLGMTILIFALPHASALLQRIAARFAGGRAVFPALRSREVGAYAMAQLIPWMVYGIAFWMFGRGVVGDRAPGVLLAVASFTAAYAWGIIWVVAPGGLGVRESALVALLSPHLGGDVAVILALGSRVWLTVVEIVGALIAIAFAASTQPTPTVR